MIIEGVDTAKQWDVIVVGTGMGGATVGSALAQRGLDVLFLEKGGRVSAAAAISEDNSPEGRLARGWWPNPVSHQQTNGTHQRFFAPVGCATGGSSIYYAAALERMAKSDFDALRTNSGLIEPWPVGYDEFLRYYVAAEELFRANDGSPEQVMRRMSEWDRTLLARMRENGLKPEPLHVAIRYDDKCRECIGTICDRNCKSDALAACLDSAIRLGNCTMLEHCNVQSLEADSERVTGVRASRLGRELILSAKVVVLAAGALHSPQILLQSSNAFWPNGLANTSDQVGRNLMFHTSDVFAVWAPRRLDRRGRQKKSISVRDFYHYQGQRLGYVQSMGLEAGHGVIASFLKDKLRKLGLHNELVLALLAKLPSRIGALIFGQAGLFAGTTEDDPSPNNRIRLDPNEPDGASFTYVITDDLRRRAQALYVGFARHIRPWRSIRISPRLEMNFGHPCGTCRFGNDPARNVLDRNCRTHDVDNLYVIDASFMPRSGAVNPSLTIAANALRVADHIAERHGKSSRSERDPTWADSSA